MYVCMYIYIYIIWFCDSRSLYWLRLVFADYLCPWLGFYRHHAAGMITLGLAPAITYIYI